ncbi:MAG: hypothetical protein AAB955_00830 [Patescibacteria group bacterium]
MEWGVSLSHQASRYLKQHRIPEEEIIEVARLAVRKVFGEKVAINLIALTGPWKGYYRARARKVRIVFAIDLDLQHIYIDTVDNRDRVYRKKR